MTHEPSSRAALEVPIYTNTLVPEPGQAGGIAAGANISGAVFDAVQTRFVTERWDATATEQLLIPTKSHDAKLVQQVSLTQ